MIHTADALAARRDRVALFGLALTAIGFAACFVLQSAEARDAFPLDDAWIHLVYARNLISGYGLAYNAGELETGLSAPLWTLLISPFSELSSPSTVVLCVKAIGLSLHIATAWLASRTLLALDVRRSIALVTAFAIVLEPWSMLAALSGMEVPLISGLLVCLMFALATERIALTLTVMSLLPLARPESLLVVLAIALLLLRARWSISSVPMRLALLFLPWLGWIAWCIYCKSVTGYAMSNTFYAKAAPSPATWLHNLEALWSMLNATLLLVIVGGIVGTAIGSSWRGAAERSIERDRVYRLLGISVVAFVCAVLFGQPLREPDRFYWLRYLLPVVPSLLLMPAILIQDTAPRWRTRFNRVGGLLALAVMLMRWPLLSPDAIRHYAGSCRNIVEMNLAVADWLREHTDTGETIATNDAGVIAYFSERPVLDLLGLNNHRAVHGDLVGEIRRMQPRYFAVFPAWFPNITSDAHFKPVFSARAEHYVISAGPQDELVVYRVDP